MPLLAVAGARTSRIEVGTGVIDKRYESPLHLAEEIVALDLLTDRASSSVSPAAPRSRRCRPDRSRPRRGVSRGFRRSRSVVVAGPVRKPVTTGPRG